MFNKFNNNDKAFTGLEAAIVLIAFVVVAAVFSYVMLGAGFYTTQKSQEVVHTGVEQASSSVELTGDLVAAGNESDEVANVTLFLQLTAGGSAVDLDNTLIVLTTPDNAAIDLTNNSTTSDGNFEIVKEHNGDGDSLLESSEKAELNIPVSELDDVSIGPNAPFKLEIKPPEGASYSIERKAPPTISNYMTLY
ncbi:MAG: archaellin/type IV pilin N-terminal domain-containing protein [Methanohalophilus sp.]